MYCSATFCMIGSTVVEPLMEMSAARATPGKDRPAKRSREEANSRFMILSPDKTGCALPMQDEGKAKKPV